MPRCSSAGTASMPFDRLMKCTARTGWWICGPASVGLNAAAGPLRSGGGRPAAGATNAVVHAHAAAASKARSGVGGMVLGPVG